MKTTNKQFKKLADKWMKKQGFENREEFLQHLLLEEHLDEEKEQPHGLYKKDEDYFLVYFFGKENYFARKKAGNIRDWVTGFDTWKFLYLQVYETLLHIPSAIVFYNEQEKDFIFRPIAELGNPDAKWRRNKEFDQDIKQLEAKKLVFASQEYRDELRHIVDRLFRNTGKMKPMSVWQIEKFLENKIQFNRRLFV